MSSDEVMSDRVTPDHTWVHGVGGGRERGQRPRIGIPRAEQAQTNREQSARGPHTSKEMTAPRSPPPPEW